MAGERTAGTVRMRERGRCLVFWDADFDVSGQWVAQDTPEDRWYPEDDLEVADERKGSPPAVYAPKVQDLELVTRLHPVTNTLIMERAETYRGTPGPVMANAHDIYDMFQHMDELDQEHIVILLLDVRNNLVGWKMVHKGKLASVEADAKDMLKDAILTSAAKVVMLHNHPSGDPTPSGADKELTEALQLLANEFGIELFDHVIIGRGFYYSFLEDGKIPEQNLQ